MADLTNTKNYEAIIKIDPETIKWFPTVALMLTKVCGLKCSFCCEPEEKIESTSLRNFNKIIDNLWEFGTKRLCLAGGDPLYYKYLVGLTSYSKSKGFYNLLLTADGNKLINKIYSFKKTINGVRLSIQGIGKKHDDFVKSKDSFSNIERSIDLLTKYNIDIMVSSVVTKDNYDEIFKIADWCQKINAQKFYLYGLLYSGRGKEYIEKNGKPTNIDFHKLVNSLKELHRNSSLSIKYYDYTYNAECILVYGNGDVIAAPYFGSSTYRLIIGNIFQHKKEDIWQNFKKDEKNLEGYRQHLNNAI